ncbi:MAG: FxsA family protein [Gammaproteobacteria bacterium]|nr:MAG: FxsA family protein [Gammaproteobacteria bacterium]
MSPFQILLLLFVLVPLLELYLLIKVGSVIGALPTVALVVLTALVGSALLRHQGLATLRRVQETLARGGVPAMELLEGALIVVGGLLLLTPGFFTDALGLLCLIPPVRRRFLRWAVRRGLLILVAGPGGPPPGPGGGRRPPIEGECTREEERGPRP